MAYRKLNPYLAALTAILLWSTMGSAFSLTLRHISPTMLVLLSSLSSLLVLSVASVVGNKKLLNLPSNAREWRCSALSGLFNPFLYYLILFKAYSLAPAQEALALNYTWPLTLSIFSMLFLGQSYSWKQWLCLLISFVGTLVIITHGKLGNWHFEQPAGDGLALLSSVVWAGYWILNLRNPRDRIAKLQMGFLTGSVYIILYVWLSGQFEIPDTKALFGGMYIGIFEMGLTFLLWLYALQNSRHTSRIANLVYLSPFLSLFWISLILGEKIVPTTLIGLALIVIGILLQHHFSKVKP